ncbi:AAA family ATPase [Nonomuraea typhae]|uniref:AAA family ATPase n=1 Tax=Nonomuraea typhae TaxID=2603600 RepID=A0ABW7YLV5_9ACTN
MTAVERVLEALRLRNLVVKEGAGQYTAQCPAHDDRSPSLSVRPADGKVLLYCHAGCDSRDVAGALELSVADLFDEQAAQDSRPVVVASYAYIDEQGEVLYFVDRLFPKGFRQRGARGQATTRGARRVPYRLPEVLAARDSRRTVYIVEGEKDADRLASLGVAATCNSMGAGKWREEYARYFAGMDVVIVADKDRPGLAHAKQVQASLTGVAASVRTVEAAEGKDVTDHLRAGYGLDDLRLVEEAPQERSEEKRLIPARRAQVTWACDIKPEPVVWAWQDGNGRIPAGSLSVAGGREGTGKSSFGIWLAAQITRGTLPGSFYGTPRQVLYVAVEDSWTQTLVPRLMAAEADLSRIGRFEVMTAEDDETILSLPHDNQLLEQAIQDHGVALVVIDPLMSVISAKIDTHRERDVRTALDPLAKLAGRTGAVLLGLAHFSKSSGTDVSSLITGSGAFKNVPRSLFGFARDETSPDGLRVMTQVKNSLGSLDLPSLAYVIEEAELRIGEETTSVGRFRFTGISPVSVGDLLGDAHGDPEERQARGEATSWLLDFLESSGGCIAAAKAIEAAKADGIAERTLGRARRKAGVASQRRGFGGGMTWVHPDHSGQHSGHCGQAPALGRNGANGDRNEVATRGQCAGCGSETERYGEQGQTLCSACRRGRLEEDQ